MSEPRPAPGGEPTARAAERVAREVVTALRDRGQTVAVAESLTGGLLGAALTDIPGASAVFRGGVIAYATDVKASALGVPASLLDACGAVHPDVAAAMADGVRRRLSADVGVGATGVAGPDPADGRPPGTAHIAVALRGGGAVRSLSLSGSRDEIRRQTVVEALWLLRRALKEDAR